MPVRAAEAKGADAGQPALLPAWPCLAMSGDLQPVVGPGNMRCGLIEMQMRRNPLLLHREYDLDATGDSGSTLEVPDIRFDRPDQQRRFPLLVRTQRAGQRARLDWIAERGGCAMRF